jgi:hypothetical protein
MGPGGCHEPGRYQEAANLAEELASSLMAADRQGIRPLPRLEVTLTCPECQAQVHGHVPQARDEAAQIRAAVADAEALVRADQEGVTPQDLLAIADRAIRMAAGLRDHIVAARLLDAWAAADWLGDLAQEVKDKLPVGSQDIIAAVEGDTLPPRPQPLTGGMGGRGVHVAEPGTDAEERARSRDTGR